MCAVVGALVHDLLSSKDVAKMNDLLWYVLKQSTERGRDGRGVYVAQYGYVPSLEIDLLPVSNPPELFISTAPGVMLANLRGEPTTEYVKEKTGADQQPYTCGKWTVVHNGTIANDKELRTNRIKTTIDSAAIAERLDAINARGLTDFAAMVRRIKGSYAIIASDAEELDRLYIACNYRPIWYLITDKGVVFASAEHFFPEGVTPRMIEPYSAMEFISENGRIITRIETLRRPRSAKRALVVCSGGLDSTVAACAAQREGYMVTLLHFKYGSRAQERERRAIFDISINRDWNYQEIDLPIWKHGDSPLLDKNSPLAGGEVGAEFAHEWVPARNLVMLAVATAYAEANRYDVIALGNNMEEAGAYPDNEPEFINKFNKLLPFAVGDGTQVRVLMPVGNLMKHEIVKLGLELDAPMHLTWSCYRNGEKHCGTCGPCFMRRTAFEINDKKDPVFE